MTQNDEMTLCRLEARHIDRMAEIEALCFSDPWSRESLASELDNPCAVYYICEIGGQVAGYVGTRQMFDVWEIVNVATDPAFRRRHVATRLLEWLLRDAKAGGAAQLWLEVRESNLPARRCYEGLGFVQVGRRKRYYENPEEDALLMAREIEQ